MKKFFGIYASSDDVQTAVDGGSLNKPYVAYVEDGNCIDWNTKSVDYGKMPLTFEILTDGVVSFKCSNSSNFKTVEYSKNGGNWTSITSSQNGTEIQVNAGDILKFQGEVFQFSYSYYNYFASTCLYNAYGNIMSIKNKNNYDSTFGALESYYFKYFFLDSKIIDASNLVLPSHNLKQGMFQHMFQGCNLLEKAPTVYFNTSGMSSSDKDNLCQEMFKYCSNLMYIKCTCLAEDLSGNNCLQNWVQGVSATGTFIKKTGVTYSTGGSGIPAGWTVIEE